MKYISYIPRDVIAARCDIQTITGNSLFTCMPWMLLYLHLRLHGMYKLYFTPPFSNDNATSLAWQFHFSVCWYLDRGRRFHPAKYDLAEYGMLMSPQWHHLSILWPHAVDIIPFVLHSVKWYNGGWNGHSGLIICQVSPRKPAILHNL